MNLKLSELAEFLNSTNLDYESKSKLGVLLLLVWLLSLITDRETHA